VNSLVIPISDTPFLYTLLIALGGSALVWMVGTLIAEQVIGDMPFFGFSLTRRVRVLIAIGAVIGLAAAALGVVLSIRDADQYTDSIDQALSEQIGAQVVTDPADPATVLDRSFTNDVQHATLRIDGQDRLCTLTVTHRTDTQVVLDVSCATKFVAVTK
jgi:hypothetical protein